MSRQEKRKETLKRQLELLAAVRRIMHSFGVHSHRMAQSSQITLPQLSCLMAVVAQEGMSSREIARRISASPSTLVGVIDRLERKGLVSRVRDPLDRRQIHIMATAAGRELVLQAPSPFGEVFDGAFDELSVERQQQIVADLGLVATMMSAEAAQDPKAGQG